MKLIVGLGNIGEKYEKTNHNAGFMIVDRLSKSLGFSFNKRGCDSDYAEFNNSGKKFIIAKPRTYMNESGRAVNSLMKKFGIDIKDVLIICDDIDQEPGRIRIRKVGSAGTHNGLKSVIREVGGTEFNRLRIGIGKQAEHQDLADFVLSNMKFSEEQLRGLDNAQNAVENFVNGATIDEIMAKFNGDINKNGKH